MLNLLSGRMTSTNLSLSGNIFINGSAVKNILEYKDFIGYVMQDDLMLATFTPYETFRFVADMRLPHKSDEEKD
jgi:ABC-type multidrug transport system ATPase subunit